LIYWPKWPSSPADYGHAIELLVLWAPGTYEGVRVVDACIKRIRQKLCVSDQAADTQRFIQTKSGVGYVFTDD
jgi:DNA-binding response OmpR family regulator